MKDIKAIITDLDGTLLHSDKTVSDYTVSILKKCRETGILVMAATARPARTIVGYRELIGFDAVVTLNGAVIEASGNIIENTIEREDGEHILSGLLKLWNPVISIETDKGIFSNVYIPEWDTAVYDGFPVLPENTSLYKILVNGNNKKLIKQTEKSLTDNTYYTIAQKRIVQIMSRNATKWNGIEAMLGHYGLSPEEAIYFGDDNDDIEPVRNCGIGVAVSNALEAVKNSADAVAESNNNDGAAKYLESILF